MNSPTGMDCKTIRIYLLLAAEQGFVAGMADEQLAEITGSVPGSPWTAEKPP